MPPRDASPEQVVRAYLDASNAHDVATMNALVVGDWTYRASRFSPTRVVTDVTIFPAEVEQSADVPVVGPRAKPPHIAEVVNVQLDAFTVHGGDLNNPDGQRYAWGYRLSRPDNGRPGGSSTRASAEGQRPAANR